MIRYVGGETVFNAIRKGSQGSEDLVEYAELYKNSWLYDELYKARNTMPLLHRFGLFLGSACVWIDQNILRGRAPFTLQDNKADYEQLKLASASSKPSYPKPDGKISFDKLSSVFLTNTSHEEDQPAIFAERQLFLLRVICLFLTNLRKDIAQQGYMRF